MIWWLGCLVVSFQSALRMRGLFNRHEHRTGRRGDHVSIRLADAWPFQLCRSASPFSNPLMVSIRLADAWPFQHLPRLVRDGDHNVSIRLADAWPFQLRCAAWGDPHAARVSIRLADAWPFQPSPHRASPAPRPGFNPPCGCVAFSTRHAAAAAGGLHRQVSIRLADAWPFQPTATRPMPAHSTTFQSALRMRGLFNARAMRGPTMAVSTFQSALRMRGLFNSQVDAEQQGVHGFQSALRMRGLFNGCRRDRCT